MKRDLTGETFNYLKVISKASSRGKNSYWLCKCLRCGQQKEIRRDILTNGTVKACGCLRADIHSIDLTNRRFGKLVAIKWTGKSSIAKDNSKRRIWLCQCDCGNQIEANVDDLTSGNKNSCGCLKESAGEFRITQILQDYNILFEKQKIFETCRFPDTLYYGRFDFYINNTYLIEYDGQQHFKSRELWGGQQALEESQKRDAFKTQWCKENNIPLIRIPYTHFKKLNINDLLLETTTFRVA